MARKKDWMIQVLGEADAELEEVIEQFTFPTLIAVFSCAQNFSHWSVEEKLGQFSSDLRCAPAVLLADPARYEYQSRLVEALVEVTIRGDKPASSLGEESRSETLMKRRTLFWQLLRLTEEGGLVRVFRSEESEEQHRFLFSPYLTTMKGNTWDQAVLAARKFEVVDVEVVEVVPETSSSDGSNVRWCDGCRVKVAEPAVDRTISCGTLLRLVGGVERSSGSEATTAKWYGV